MMEKCVRCAKNEEQVRLFDGIYVNEPVKICERCAIIAQVPLIKRPTPEQLKDSEKPLGVRQRLARMAGLGSEQRKDRTVKEELEEIEKNPSRASPEELVFKLVDNFHWVMQTQRRRKGFSTRQLAEALGESESAIKMLEKGIIPSKSLDLITKIEQFLDIKLIKKDLLEKLEEQKRIEQAIKFKKEEEERKRAIEEERRVTLDRPETNPLGVSEKEEMKIMRQAEGEDMLRVAIKQEKNPKALEHEQVGKTPLRTLDFKRSKIAEYTVADLKRLDSQVEKDFSYNKKTPEQVGNEQFDSFGKEDTDKLMRKVQQADEKKHPERYEKKVPSIYDLMKKKEEKEKLMVGKDIEVVEEGKKSSEEFEM